MKFQKLISFLIVIVLLITCTSCDIAATMPHGSEEYESGNWSVNELVEHFEELGFTDIKVEEKTTFEEEDVKLQVLIAEDSTSWSPSYRSIEGGETIDLLRTIIIRETKLIPVLNATNCPEFAEFIENGKESSNNTQSWTTFLKENTGKALAFDGTISDWHDSFWWITGIDFTITIENSKHLNLSWNVDSLDGFGLPEEYDHENYYSGLITVGTQVHILAMIKGESILEIESMEII